MIPLRVIIPALILKGKSLAIGRFLILLDLKRKLEKVNSKFSHIKQK